MCSRFAHKLPVLSDEGEERESRPSSLVADDPTKRVFKKLSQSAYILVTPNREHKVVSAQKQLIGNVKFLKSLKIAYFCTSDFEKRVHV